MHFLLIGTFKIIQSMWSFIYFLRSISQRLNVFFFRKRQNLYYVKVQERLSTLGKVVYIKYLLKGGICYLILIFCMSLKTPCKIMAI